MEEKRADCEREFLRIWDRLSKGDAKFDRYTEHAQEQDLELTSMKAHMAHLIDSMAGLTKAIWGMVSAILLMLAGFFIWYVQSGGHS